MLSLTNAGEEEKKWEEEEIGVMAVDRCGGDHVLIGAIEENQVLGMKFEVGGVKKALAAVWKICENDNIFCIL